MDTISSRYRQSNSSPNNVNALLLDYIQSGRYRRGDRLPSIRVLSEELNVAQEAIRAAIAEMTLEGFLDRRPHCRAVVGEAKAPPNGSETLSMAPAWDPARVIALVMWRWDAGELARSAQRRVFLGMDEALQGSGRHGICIDIGHNLEPGPKSPESEEDHLRYAFRQGFGGVVYYPQNCRIPQWISETPKHMPLVLLNRTTPGVQSDFIGSDFREATRQAAWRLIHQGHQRIAFVTSGEYTHTEQERIRGYRQALLEAFSTEAYEMVLSPPPNYANVWAMLDATVRQPLGRRPTAMICAGGQEADRVARHLAMLGLQAPQDVSLIALDDILQTLPNGVGLTTVAQSFEEIGRAAAKLILRRHEHPTIALTHVVLPTRLIERDSIRCVSEDALLTHAR
ncbi:MAG: substrate-binding domain-containing protein [Capsulimonas sp.]|uniref:substrate-binding domain-containing protein n=1 Tax=Capsulimonas sp. TaxID=2494211 RepID=UPI0032677EF3